MRGIIFRYGAMAMLMGVAVLIALSATPAFAPDKADYVKYIGSSISITQAYSEYQICNPTISDISVSAKSKSTFNWYFTEAKGKLTDSWIERLTNVSYSDKCFTGTHDESHDVDISKNATTCDKLGCKDGKDANTCSCTNIISDYSDCTKYRMEWQKWNPVGSKFDAGKCFNIRVYGKYPVAYGSAGVRIDNVIEVAGNNYDEYAWYNATWTDRWNTTDANTTFIPYPYAFHQAINATYEGYKVCDIRIVNNTGSEIGFAFIDDGDGTLEAGEEIYYLKTGEGDYTIYADASSAVDCANSSIYEITSIFYDNFNAATLNTTNWQSYGTTKISDGGRSGNAGCFAGASAWFVNGIEDKLNYTLPTNYNINITYFFNATPGTKDDDAAASWGNWTGDWTKSDVAFAYNTYDANQQFGGASTNNQYRVNGGGWANMGADTMKAVWATSYSLLLNTTAWEFRYNATNYESHAFAGPVTDAGHIAFTHYDNAKSTCVDDVTIRKHAYAEPVSSFKDIEYYTLAMDIDLYSPANATTISNGQLLNFSAVSHTDASFNCFDYLDGAEYDWGSVTNASFNTRTIGYGEGMHNLTIVCNDSMPSSITETRIFTNNYFNGTYANSNLIYTTPQQELSTYLYSVSYQNTSNITNIATSMNWNGTYVTANKSGDTHSAYYFVPLLSANNTLLNPTFNSTITYNNGTTQTWSSSVMPIALLYSYNMTGLSNQANATEGENVTFTSTYWNSSALATLSQSILFNGASYSGTIGSDIRNYVVMPSVAAQTTYGANSSLTISYGGRSRTQQFNSTIDVYPLNISSSGALAINYTCYDELTLAQHNCSSNQVYYAWNSAAQKNFTFNFTTPTNTLPIYIFPDWATFNANASMDYKNELLNYGQREYYLIDGTISNATQNISLYMLNSSYASTITFNVLDENNIDVTDAVIKVFRFYKEENAYRIVAMAKTGSGGTAPIRLQLVDATYKYEVWKGGARLGTFNDEQLVSTSKQLKLSAAPLASFFGVFSAVTGSCSVNASKYLNCNATDTSGRINTWYLDVWERSAVNITAKLCTLSGATAAQSCYLSSYPNNTYYYNYYGAYTGGKYVVASGSLGNGADFNYGTLGVFAAMFIIMALALSGYWNPAVSVTLTGLGIVFCVLMGLLPLAESVVVSILCVLAIVVYKLRS